MASKYAGLLKDRNVHRWYRNLARGSRITADVYLRRLGRFCKQQKSTPTQLLKRSDRSVHDMLFDTVTDMEERYAGGYIQSVVKAVKSWLAFNDRHIRRRINIKGARETPTLKDERIPSQQELQRIFLAADEKARTIAVLMAHSGVRPEVLGNYAGDDGLRLRDLPELELSAEGVRFQHAPSLVRVRPALSKKGNEYFTFVSEEGCRYIKDYLDGRQRQGEQLSPGSPLIRPKTADKDFITTVNIGDAVRKALRKAGFLWRPYVLRSYFATQLMLAESKGLIIRDYRSFFMGHKGDIEAVYTVNKRKLPEQVVEQMRDSYRKAQRYLQTTPTEGGDSDLRKEIRRQLMLAVGFKAEEIKDEYLEMEENEFQKLAQAKQLEQSRPVAARQKVVDVSHIENYLGEGWEFVGSLPDRKAILKMREPS